MKSEHDDNWLAICLQEVAEISIPIVSNESGSHMVYNIKTEEYGGRILKESISIHGNRDTDKD